jgi:flagellar hook-basal body protein
MRNADGDLVMVAGHGRVRVLSEGGAPIKLASSGTVSISDDGMVRQNGQALGRLRVVDFADPQQLRKMGSSLYKAGDDAESVPAQVRVRSGHLERSTVSPVEGLASMIKISRAYQMNANMIQLQDQTLNAAVNRVGRVG